MKVLSTILVVLALAACARGEDAPADRIQTMIEDMVKKILDCQQGGRYVLGAPSGQDTMMLAQFPQGQTALGVLALQYARPHLKGDLQTQALDGIRKGLANLAQQQVEARTYSAGLILTVFVQEDPDRNKKLIDTYAKMLILSQHDKGEISGEWGYRLLLPPGVAGEKEDLDDWGDKSNTQFALLGLYNADRAGFQVPDLIWQRAADHYVKAQFPNGGWGYRPQLRPQPYMNMTVASTISLQLCEEMLLSQKHKQCKPPPRSKAVDAGIKWIADNWDRSNIGTDPYGLYALERLGILMGRANLGGHDWYNEGANALLNARQISVWGTPECAYCFAVAYLARGLEPIVINKLERPGTDDWNNDPYDVKHLVEHLQDRFQLAVQWRIVTLEAPLELLLKTPILYISGHDALAFSDAEKTKLKAYVAGGGTILAQACCAKKPFDTSVRALAKELFAGEFQPFPKTSRLFERMKSRGVDPKAEVLSVALENQQGRPAILYLTHDYCCRWQSGGAAAREPFAVGAGIYFFVANECRQMYEASKPAPAPTPVPDPAPATTPMPAPATPPAPDPAK